MSRHQDKLHAHAERQLAPARSQRPTEVLPIYAKFLKIEEHRLRLKHQAGGGGREICALRAALVDLLLRRVFTAAADFARQSGTEASALSLVALGGYGRGELNPYSDVDVMFLHASAEPHVNSYVKHVVEQVLYLLWDIGFKVGHSTRSVDEAIAQANGAMFTKTAMLESRLVTGDAAVDETFRRRFRAECVDGLEPEYLSLRMDDQEARHKKFGGSVYMQEPNLKNGCGGLRDYQNLLWMTCFREGSLATTALVGKDWLSEADRRRIEAAYDFLLRVRTDLHYLTDRPTDILHMIYQEPLAHRLGYRQRSPILRSEALMKDYYEHTRNIFRVTEQITERFAVGSSSGESAFVAASSGANEEQIEEFVIRGTTLSTSNNEIFSAQPELMMRAFQLAQERQLELSPQLSDLITRNLGSVTRTFCYATTPREMFLGILAKKGAVGRILRAMHRVDFLGRYLPEFGGLTCLVQHEFFHRFTADEHTLVCIEKLDALALTEDAKFLPYRQLFESLSEPVILYLALLLHDTGRAVGARPHSEASAVFAQRAALRLQLTPPQRRMLIRLVDHHVTLSNLAQQRNLDDPETALEFAAVVKDQPTLDALMLLTLADGQGTSADGWSVWKESLVWQLYRATSTCLADQQNFVHRANVERESLQRSVAEELSDDFDSEIDAHFEFMPDNYFRAFDVSSIGSHVELFREFLRKLFDPTEPPLSPAVHWEAFPKQGHAIASFCLWDAQHLLANIAGALAVVPLNILSADIYTRGDNVVLDVFRVCDLQQRAVTDPRDHALVERTLRDALNTEVFDFRPLLERARKKVRKSSASREMEFPTRITVDNKAHRTCTLVQIQTLDRVGLLYDLLSAFAAAGIAIVLSRVSTENGAAIDTFYVAEQVGRGKVTNAARVAELQEQLRRAALGDFQNP